MQGAPEAVARLGVIGLPDSRGRAGAGATEDDPKAIDKKVFENVSHGAPRASPLLDEARVGEFRHVRERLDDADFKQQLGGFL